MNTFEQVCTKTRHLPFLNRADWLWNTLRPTYDGLIRSFAQKGLRRHINGQDELRVSAKWRGLQETYEPEFWNKVMEEVRPSDTFVDVGGFIGVYSICAARRAAPNGRAYVFEPDETNYSYLCEHLRLNKLSDSVHAFKAAVTDFDGMIAFHSGKSCESHIVCTQSDSEHTVACLKLDTVLAKERIDLVKIDVEGFEEHVLRGSQTLLKSKEQRPRAIYIEVHPFAWAGAGTTSDSLIKQLESCGYKSFTLNGAPVTKITEYGSIVARRVND